MSGSTLGIFEDMNKGENPWKPGKKSSWIEKKIIDDFMRNSKFLKESKWLVPVTLF